jgi:hypothetical protein
VGVVWIRISVLAAIFAVVAAVSLTRLEQAPGKPVATKYGATSQGRAFALKLDADKTPVAFDTALSALCPMGRTISMPWSPVAGDGVRFNRDGDRLKVAEWGDGWRLELDGRVSDGGALRGTMSLVVNVRPKTRAPFDCRSPKVRFSAGR